MNATSNLRKISVELELECRDEFCWRCHAISDIMGNFARCGIFGEKLEVTTDPIPSFARCDGCLAAESAYLDSLEEHEEVEVEEEETVHPWQYYIWKRFFILLWFLAAPIMLYYFSTYSGFDIHWFFKDSESSFFTILVYLMIGGIIHG